MNGRNSNGLGRQTANRTPPSSPDMAGMENNNFEDTRIPSPHNDSNSASMRQTDVHNCESGLTEMRYHAIVSSRSIPRTADGRRIEYPKPICGTRHSPHFETDPLFTIKKTLDRSAT
jgi:hypothetical protein